jgi:hypothetical protein
MTAKNLIHEMPFSAKNIYVNRCPLKTVKYGTKVSTNKLYKTKLLSEPQSVLENSMEIVVGTSNSSKLKAAAKGHNLL